MLKKKNQKSGQFIVIDGGDGSGKATQAELLVDYLRSRKIKVKYLDFPQYHKFFGEIVGRFLAGEFGQLDAVSPYLAAIPFALDRWSMKDEIESWLNSGGYIVSNRYTPSTLAHQTARIPSASKRQKFMNWATELEYVKLGLPKEDLVVYLRVPPATARKLTALKNKRIYIKRKLDIAEENLKHQEDSAKMYLHLAKTQNHWILVNCADRSNNILPIASIHKYIVQSICTKIPKLCHPKSKALQKMPM